MTTNTNAALRTIADWPITDPANMDAVNMAEIARAALTTAAAVPPEGVVMVPVELAERVQESLGEFLMDHGWSQRDMDTSDEFGAVLLAAAPKAEPVQAGEYPPLPEWSKMDNLGGLVPSEIRQELRAYVDSDRALRAQAAPAVAAADVLEQIANEPPINGNNLAAVRVMLAAQMLRDQITEAAAAPQPAVQQGDAQPMQPSDDDVICPSCSHQFRAIPVNVQKLMLDAGIAPPFTSSAQKDVAMDTFQKNGIAWAVDRWKSEVMNRPMRNLHRRSLDDAWRQVVRYFGGCPDTLLGPCHDASRAQAEEGGAS